MSLKERWTALIVRIKTEETKFGKILIKYFGAGGIASAVVAHVMEVAGAMPQDFIDAGVKYYIGLASLILAGIGKLTAKNTDTTPDGK